MNGVVMILIAVQELNAADWQAFKANWAGSAQDVYEAYAALRDSCDSNTSVCENLLWNWYCELTNR